MGTRQCFRISRKTKIIAEGKKLEEQVISEWSEGLLSEEEKYQKIIEIWTHVKKDLEKVLPNTLDKKTVLLMTCLPLELVVR